MKKYFTGLSLLVLTLLSRDIQAQQIVSFQYWFDSNIANATSVGITPAALAVINNNVSTSSLTPGFHTVTVQALDSAGNLSVPLTSAFVNSDTDISAYEYWFDNNIAGATMVNITPFGSGTVNANVSTAALSPGFHFITVMMMNTSGVFSAPLTTAFVNSDSDIVAYQYWFDNNIASATTVSITPVGAPDLNVNVATTALSPGFHFITVQMINTSGVFSAPLTTTFVKAGANLVKYEYWFDGNKSTEIDVPFTATQDYTVTDIDASSITAIGQHLVTIQVQDELGNLSVPITDTFKVKAPALLISDTIVNELCNGASGGSITLSVTGGAPPYRFSWNNGDTTKNIAALTAGTYTISITDTIAGDTVTASFMVNQPQPLNITDTVTENSCSNASTGAINLAVSGGMPGYTFLWSNNDTSENLSSLSTGTYKVTVKDANGCTTVDSFSVANIANSVTPSVTINNPGPICSGTSVTFIATPTNGGSAPNFNFKVNGISVQNGASSGFNGTSLNNNDIVTCVMTSNASCASPATATSNADTMTVSTTVTPSVSINNPGPICSGSSVSITSTPTNGGSFPIFKFQLNGAIVQIDTSATFTSASLKNGDVITCIMTGSASCASPATATSNSDTMKVTPTVAPSVSITGPGPICSNSTVTFIASGSGAGNSPDFNFMVNGISVQNSTSPIFDGNALNNNDIVTCVMTSNASCASPTTATSNIDTMTVTTAVTPSVLINNPGPICTGTSVTITATPTNGGSAPNFNFRVNGTSVQNGFSASFTSSSLGNGNLVTCVMTSNASCASPTTASSNTDTMTVNATLTPSVSINNPGPICTGTSVTIAATPINGGSAPNFNFTVNGISVQNGASASFTSGSLSNGNVVTCVMTSNASCASPTTATSNIDTMTVTTAVTPSVLINNPGPICTGTSVTITAIPTNGGSAPNFNFTVNGASVQNGASASFTSASLSNGNVVTCVMTSNASCASPTTANSNSAIMTVNPVVTPSVSINNPGPVNSGTSATITATPTNGGSAPTFNFMVNGTSVQNGASASFTSTSFANGNVVNCVMTSNATCASPTTATSNSDTLTVNSSGCITPAITIGATPSGAICTGTTVVFNANVTNAGTSPTFQWQLNGENIGNNNPTFSSNTLTNGNIVTCKVTNNSLASCPVTSAGITMTVNPALTINPVASQVLCPGSSSSPISFSGTTPLTNFNWTNNRPAIGLAASGSGNISSFTVVNTGPTPAIATITVTPASEGFAYIANFGSNTVSEINTSTNAVVATIPVGGGPSGVALNPEGSLIYVTNGSSRNVSVVNTSNNLVTATISVGIDPFGISISPNGSQVYVANAGSDNVSVINALTNTVTATIPLGTSPQGICVSPDGSRLYVTNYLSNTVSVISTSTDSVTATIPVNSPRGVCISPDGSSVYTANGGGSVSVINTSTNAMTSIALPLVSRIFGICISPNGRTLYVTSDSVSVINTSTNTIMANIAAGDIPEGVSVSPDGSRLYVANGGSDNVSVVNTANNKVVNTITVGEVPISLGNFVGGNICAGAPTAFTITVNSGPASSVTVNASATTVCPGTPVTFTATLIRTIGAPPVYQWWRNNNPVGTNSPTLIDSLVNNGDSVWVSVLISGQCTGVATETVTSAKTFLTVPPVPTVTVSPSATIICGGTAVTFKATATNGGTNPVFQWQINRANTGTNNATFITSALTNNDTVICTVTSSTCPSEVGTSAGIIITVNTIPTVNPIASQVLCRGASSSPVTFTGAAPKASFKWVNSNPGFGLAASGFDSIPSFTATNPGTATITVTPALGFAYIANSLSNNVSVINTSTNTIEATIPVGIDPIGVSVSPDGSHVYVTNNGSKTVSVISTSTNTVTATVPVDSLPFGVCVNPNGQQVYVGNKGSGTVSVINTSNNNVTSVRVVGGTVSGSISISPDGRKLFIAGINNANTEAIVSVMNIAANTFGPAITVGSSISLLTVSPDGTKLYVGDGNNNTVSVFDISTPANTHLATIPVGTNPTGICVGPDGNIVYVCNFGSNTVSVINTSTNTVTATVPVGSGPEGISISPDGSLVYVCNFNSITASVINTATNVVSNTINLNSRPQSFGNFVSGNICPGTPTTFKITVEPGPPASVNVNASATTVCPGSAVIFAATLTHIAGAAPVYQWWKNNGPVGTNSPTFIDSSANNNDSVWVTVVISAQCTASSSPTETLTSAKTILTVPLVPSINISSSATTICTGNTVNFIATAINGGVRPAFQWQVNGVNAGTNRPNFTTNPLTSNSIVTCSVASSICPTQAVTSAGIFITVDPALTVNTIANQALCAGSSTGAVSFSGAVPQTTFNWTNSNPSIGLAASGSGNIPSFIVTNTTPAPVTSTITVTPALGFAYIANFGSRSVSVINTATSAVVATIPVGKGPEGVSVSPDGSRVYVANDSSNNVSVINTATNTVTATIPVGNFPIGITVSLDGSRVYATNNISDNVSVINTTTNKVVATIPVERNPVGVAVSPDGSRVYVTNFNANSVSVINTSTNTEMAIIPVGSAPNGITISPNGNELYVTNYDGNSVSVINTSTNAVTNTITVGANPVGVYVSPNGSQVYVANEDSNSLSVISTASQTVTNTIKVGGFPSGVSVSPDGSRVYVTNNGSENTSVINAATNTVVNTIPVGVNPTSLGNFVSGNICATPVTFGITVNPVAEVAISASATTICPGTAVTFTATTINGGTHPAFQWQINGVNAGTNSPTLTNSTLTNGSIVTCSLTSNAPRLCNSIATSNSIAMTVNPTVTVNAVNSQTVCAGAATGAITFSGAVPQTIFNWTNSNPTIGLAPSGSGNISSFVPVNTGPASVTSTVTVSPAFGYAYVNTGGNVSVLNTLTNTLVTTLRAGSQPTGFSVSADGSRVYITNPDSNNVTVINAFTNTLTATIPVGNAPFGICVSPDGSWVYVANENSNTVSVINASADTVVATIPVGLSPIGVAASPDGSRVYISNNASNTVSFISTSTNTVTATIPVGTNPDGVAISPDGSEVFVANFNSHSVSAINTSTNAVATIGIPQGSAANAVCVSPNGSRAYVTYFRSDSMAVINTANNTIVTTIKVGSAPAGVSVSADGSRVFVANGGSNFISVISTATNTTMDSIPVGSTAFAFGNFVSGNTCTGPPSRFTITVDPAAAVRISASETTICAGTSVTFTATPTNGGFRPTFQWQVNGVNRGTNSATFTIDTLTNSSDVITCTLTSNAPGLCRTTATSTGISLAVNPVPAVNAIANQVVCAGTAAGDITFSGTAAQATYKWTNSNPAIGLAASGFDSIPSFTAVNASANPITSTVTVTTGLEFAYIANFVSNNVSVINTNTGAVVNTIPVGTEPEGVSVSPDGSRVYVTNFGSNNVSVINTSTNTVIATVTVGTNPFGVTVSPNGAQVYVANEGSGTVSVINTITNTIAGAPIAVGRTVLGVTVSPNGSLLYVTGENIARTSLIIAVYNIPANTPAGIIPVTTGINQLAVSPNGSHLYVSDAGSNSVSVFNIPANTLAATIPVGLGPISLCVSPDGSKVYVANDSSNNVSVINTSTNTVTAIIPIGNFPFGISLSPDGSTLYVVNDGTNANNVSVINTATNEVINTIPVGSGPTSIGNFVSGSVCDGASTTFTITVNDCNKDEKVPASGEAITIKGIRELKAYPNPTSGHLNVVFDASANAKFTFQVVDVVGNLIIKEPYTTIAGDNLKELDLSRLAKGVYFINVTDEGVETRTIRIVVQ